jgi:single-strand DNA-binding protein
MSLKVYAVGRLTHEPEIRDIGNGKRVAQIRLAFDQGWGDRKHTVYLDAEFFNGKVDVIEKFVKKGQQVMVDGELHEDTFMGKDAEGNQVERKKFRIKNGDITLLGSKSSDDESPAPPANTGKNTSRVPTKLSGPPRSPRKPVVENDGDDDIPF